ncbi:hypothetical protein N825_03460 [Skermanella stibiiresistens SB22]|uniref:Uncharacterized protein n=1 Tax=Skermanella stibiiresistens SB22 TaxID=1385369 RepID=W9H273_9PROT|nr:hypothetical protein [Skermanella stibiiresistens]EWY40139.1 hypothetical protein N825_03460 [Skermanella stibiiresistens SB22]
MATPKNRPSDTVTARVEHALSLTKGRLRLWLVFEDDAAAAEARTLIQVKKARNLLALSRKDLERRHEKAVREILDRYGARQPLPITEEEPVQPPAPRSQAPKPRRKANSRQHADAVSG